MESTQINYTKIIMIIVIISGLITGLVLLRNTLAKNCSSGEVYDNKLGCIKDCSSLLNTHYSTETKDCVTNCLSNEKDCGGVCYSSDRNQQCLNNYVCQLNQTLCGSSCMNNNQSCIKGIIYDSSQVCDDNPDNPVICDNKLTQCDKVKKACAKCEKGRVLCSDGVKDAVCCPENNFCNTDGTCTACDPKTTTVCGNNCCENGTLCKSDNSGCVTCLTSLCKDICLKDGQSCTDNGPCDPDNVYEKGGVKYCCDKKTCNGKCCDTNQSCKGNKCMDNCGSNFCDPDTQTCFVDKTNNKSYCTNNKCVWSEIVYDPQSIKYGTTGQQLEICGLTNGSTSTYWAKKQQNLTRTAKDVQSSKIDCDSNDCSRRSAENGLNKVEFDSSKKTCNSSFNCDKLLPDTFTSCPLDNKKSCCTDASSGAFTGQVCLDGNICIDGVCGPFDGYYCQENGQCVQGKSFDKGYPFFQDENSCTSKCLPKEYQVNGLYTKTEDTDYGTFCDFGKDAFVPIGVCKQRASSKQNLNTDYNWSCGPQFDGDSIIHDSKCNIYCNCDGTRIDNTIYHA